jgi:3-hydroxy-9,10-secoandrosta-1,3,5(10)-triene-9,17-dione monooxygenase
MGRVLDDDSSVLSAIALQTVFRERSLDTERLRRLPDETVYDLKDAGLFGLMRPTCYGGCEADPDTLLRVILELSAADASVGWVYSVLSIHSWLAACFSPSAVAEVWEENPDALISSAAFCMKGGITSARDGYTVKGRYGFASGSHHSQWTIIFGVPDNAPEQGLLGILVPAQDFQVLDSWHVMGLCGTGSCDVDVDAAIPQSRVISMDRLHSEVSESPLYRLPFRVFFNHAVTAPLVGAARGGVLSFVQSQRDRRRLDGSIVGQNPGVVARVAEAMSSIDTAELILRRNISNLFEAAKSQAAPASDLLLQAARDQVRAAQYAVFGIDHTFGIAGARSLSVSDPLQRMWRDVHAAAAHPAMVADEKLLSYGSQLFGS